MLQENEHENAFNWYEEVLERVEEAQLEAGANLEERKEESHSALSSMKLSKSSADSHVAEIRAKMALEEIKARQLEMEEERRTREFAKQLEIKHKIEQAGNVAQKIELEAKERRKTQEAKDEGADLAAEAENLEKVRNFVHDPESLPNRLRDFDDDSREFIPLSGFTQSVQTSHVTSLFSSFQPLSGSMHNVHATQVTSSPMFMKPRPSGLKASKSPKHQHLLTSPGLKVYQKQHKLILHRVLSKNMLLMALQVFLSYSSRNLTVTLCNGLIGHRCSIQLFMMLICL